MKTKHLNTSQFQNLLDYLNRTDDPRCTLLYLLAVTAIRADELVSLTFKDIDLSSGAVNITASKGSRDRSLYLPDILCARLAAFLKQCACTDLAQYSLMYLLGSRYHDAHLVKSKRHAAKQALRDYWRDIRPKIGAVTISLHGLRHTIAVKALESGMALNGVQSILGHKRLSSTEHYLGYIEAQEAQANVLNILGLAIKGDKAS